MQSGWLLYTSGHEHVGQARLNTLALGTPSLACHAVFATGNVLAGKGRSRGEDSIGVLLAMAE